jgi:hypothetical protein
MSIKHKEYSKVGEGYHYLCNQACIVNPKKMSPRWENVTCKNCLRLKQNDK